MLTDTIVESKIRTRSFVDFESQTEPASRKQPVKMRSVFFGKR